MRQVFGKRIAVWSLSTLLLAMVPECHAGDLFTIPAEGGEATLLLRRDDRAFGSPDWSPDGKVIAMDTWPRDADTGGLAAEIGLYFLETGELKLFGPGAMPSWSPDGKQIVCHKYSPNQIVVLNTDGTGREAIFDQWGSPVWSPDGRSIFTAHQDGGLARFELRTAKQSVVAAEGTRLWQGISVSPDGKRFCMAASGGGLGVATKQATGTFKTHWHWPRYEGRHSTWSPDSKQLVSSASLDGKDENWGVYFLDPEGVEKPKLVPGCGTLWRGSSPDWSHDGKSIVLVGQATVKQGNADEQNTEPATTAP